MEDSGATVHMDKPVGGPAMPAAPAADQRTMMMPTFPGVQPKGQLEVKSGPDAGTKFALGSEIAYLGRAKDNQLVVSDPATSRRHARFEMREHKFILVDLGSANGTAIDGVRVALEQPLTNGCSIAIGQNVMEVSIT
jgi:pSer/pThr/pTyr-binding forkhead associated (FHA) protein